MIWRNPPVRSNTAEATLDVGLIAALVDALAEPTLAFSMTGLVIAANAPAREALGADPRGQPLSFTIRAPDVLAALQQVIEHGRTEAASLSLRGAVPRRFAVHLAPVAGMGAGILQLKDLTREERIEQMRADFVANASHELRTPLAALIGFIETLEGPARADQAARTRFLGLMKAQGQRMARLIDDLLSLSRIETRAHSRPSSPQDLGRIAAQVADSLSGIAREAGVSLDLAISAPLPVLGDSDELTQVVQNLIDNALKYASAGKRVQITGAVEGTQAVLSVRDFGPGIAPAHIPRLTERFYRVDVQESRARGGTGLGLAIVKHILNRHQGRLAIESRQGAGSRFSVRIPLYVVEYNQGDRSS